MTATTTEALPASGANLPEPPQLPAGAAQMFGRMSGGLATAAIAAMAAYGSGIAARYGFHLSVPFLAGWLTYLLAILATSHFTSVISRAWHAEKAEAVAEIHIKAKAAELFAEQFVRNLTAVKLGQKPGA